MQTQLKLSAYLFFASCSVGYAQLHFASLGNWGSGTGQEITTVETLKKSAKSNSYSFIVSPGSNFVNGGITDINDTAWDSAFEKPFAGNELHVPFYSVLGVQDWSGNATAQIEKGNQPHVGTTPVWIQPNWFYHYIQHFQDATDLKYHRGAADVSAAFVFIDTHILSYEFPFQNITKEHWDYLRDTLQYATQTFDWLIVVGDASLTSSGASKGNSYLRRALGSFLKESNVDLYISGNDYDLEVLQDESLTLANCGSGSASDIAIRAKSSKSIFYSGRLGFCHHVITKSAIITNLVDGKDGTVLHSYTQARRDHPRSIFDRFKLYKMLPEIRFLPVPAISFSAPPVADWFIHLLGTIGILVFGTILSIGFGTFLHRSKKQ